MAWRDWSRSAAAILVVTLPQTSSLPFTNLSHTEEVSRNCVITRRQPEDAEDLPDLPPQDGTFLLLALLAVCYFFILLARVCEGYFVPCIKIICFKVGLSGDVAGATLLAGAVSSPDLFINMVGTFLTEGDIGPGTVVGCGVLNMLLIPPACLLFSRTEEIKLDCWAVSRDSLVYGASVLLLSLALRDNTVYWDEALGLVLVYLLYIVGLYFDTGVRRSAKKAWKKLRGEETAPLLVKRESDLSYGMEEERFLFGDFQQTCLRRLCTWPAEDHWVMKAWWLLTRPADLILYSTVPHPASHRGLYPLTFLACLLWVAGASYAVAYILTLAGLVFEIPDSLMGLTILAIGMSVPGVVSSVIVAKQGHGGMAVANALGSNTFDALVCLGLPWLLKTAQGPPLRVNSLALPYSCLLLLSTLGVLYLALATTAFTITKQLSKLCVVLYFCFTIVASLLEMNVISVGIPAGCT